LKLMALLHTSSVYDLTKLREGVERLAELSFERAIIYGKVRRSFKAALIVSSASIGLRWRRWRSRSATLHRLSSTASSAARRSRCDR